MFGKWIILGCFGLLACNGPAFGQFSSRSSGTALERSLLFHPVAHSERWLPAPQAWMVEDVWLQTKDGTKIHAWWFPHSNPKGAVLFCHGNAGNLSYWGASMAMLRSALDRSVLIFDYPGYGQSQGQPSEAGCYAAADAAYAWLTETQGIPANQILLHGESLGGGVATDLAVRKQHGGLVLFNAFTSVPNVVKSKWFLWSSSSLVRNEFDNLTKIKRCSGPVFIAYGDQDKLIPVSHGKKLYEAAPEPKRHFTMKGCGHNDPVSRECLAALADFLE